MPSKSRNKAPGRAKSPPGRASQAGEQPATRRAAQPKATEPADPTASQAEIDPGRPKSAGAGPRPAWRSIDQGPIAVAVIREGLDAEQIMERFGVSRSYAFRVIAWAKSTRKDL